MLSSDVNTSHLASNVDIVFTDDGEDNLQCVWLNEETGNWETSGCNTTIMDNGQILCSCSHLTTFSMMKFLYDDCLSNGKYRNQNMYDLPYLSNFVFLVLFIGLSIKITSDFILIFQGSCYKRMKKHFTDSAFSGPSAVYLCVLFEVLICLEFHIVFTFEWKWSESVIILSLLIPLISFCWMFFGVLKTWIRITHSFGGDVFIVQRIERGMMGFMIGFFLFIVAEITLIFLEIDYYIYGEFVWCICMSIFTISYIIYASSAIKVIWESVMAVQRDVHLSNQHNNKEQDEDFKLLKKLLSVSITLAAYFVIKTALTIYLATVTDLDLLYHFAWRVVDMIIEFMALCVIYHLYGGGIRRLIVKYNNVPIWRKCYKRCKLLYAKKKSKSKISGFSASSKQSSASQSHLEMHKLGRKKSHARIISKSRENSGAALDRNNEMDRSYAEITNPRHSQIAAAYLETKQQIKFRNHALSTTVTTQSGRRGFHSATNTLSNVPTITQTTFDYNNSDTYNVTKNTNNNGSPFQSPTFQSQESHVVKKQTSLPTTTATFSNIPSLKQLELPESATNLYNVGKVSNIGNYGKIKSTSYTHQLQSSASSFDGDGRSRAEDRDESSLYEEFSTAARLRFASSLQRRSRYEIEDGPLPDDDDRSDDNDNADSTRDPSINISFHPQPSPSPNHLGNHSTGNPSPSPITPAPNLLNDKQSKMHNNPNPPIILHPVHPSQQFAD